MSAEGTATPTAKSLRRLFLTIFLRGHSARGLRKSTVPRSIGSKLFGTLVLYFLLGLLALTLRGRSLFLLSVVLHGSTFFFLGTFVAGSAGEMLFNKEEADILLHLPVSPRDLLWAKVRVLVEVSLWIVAAFNLPGMLGALTADGGALFVFAHAISSILEALFCAAIVVVTYQLCLRWCGRERLEGIMTTAQVGLSMATVLASQLLPRMLGRMDDRASAVLHSAWLYLLPPAWFAYLDEVLTGHFTPASVLLAACGVAATAALLVAAFGKLAHDYETGLQRMSDAPGALRAERPGRPRLLDRLVDAPPLRWWLRDPVVRASFLLCSAYLVRDRDVKLRVYPALAPMLVMPLFMFVSNRGGDANFSLEFPVAFAGTFAAIAPMLALNLLQFSRHWNAAEIFRTLPLAGPNALGRGMRRAVCAFLAVPLFVCFGAACVLLSRSPSRLLLLLPGAMLLPVFAQIPSLTGAAVPLSRPPEDSRAASRGLSMLGTMVVAMLVALGAMFSWSSGWFAPYLLVEAVIAATVFLALRRRLSKTKWEGDE